EEPTPSPASPVLPQQAGEEIQRGPVGPSGPLPQQAGGEVQRRAKDCFPVERQLSPPRSKSEVGEGTAGRRPGVGGAPQVPGGVRPKAGGGRERSEPEACVRRTDPLPGFAGTPPASWGRNPKGASRTLRATPPASWGRNPKKTQGLLPRGAAAQSPTKQERSGGRHRRPQAGGRGRAAGARGSTAEGREGARAKRARGLRPKNRPPPRLRRYSPSKLGEKAAPPRPSGPLPQQAGGESRAPSALRATPPASWGRNPEPCGNMTIPDSSCTIRIH